MSTLLPPWSFRGYTLRPARKEDAEDYYRAGFDPLDPELARLTGSRASFSRDEVGFSSPVWTTRTAGTFCCWTPPDASPGRR